jgi:hypothetical protein
VKGRRAVRLNAVDVRVARQQGLNGSVVAIANGLDEPKIVAGRVGGRTRSGEHYGEGGKASRSGHT